MSTCHNCDESRIEYTSNGASLLYSFPFEYNTRDDILVATKNLNNTYSPVANSTWGFANDTTVQLYEPFPAGQKFMIYRCTDINPLPAEFFPGNSIKAQDLNDNFFVIQSAIEENRCSISKLDDEFVNTITQAEQENGLWTSFDDQRLASSDAIRARHDVHVTDQVPPEIEYEQPGKGWENTDKCWSSYWNNEADAWVAYVNTGPRGVQGPQGPPGQSIVGPDGPEGPQGPSGGTFPDAPSDGKTYGRKDANWKEVSTPSIGDATITVRQGGINKGSFTTNQATNAFIDLDSGGSTPGVSPLTFAKPLVRKNDVISIDLLTLTTAI
jgi:hypothetical protein